MGIVGSGEWQLSSSSRIEAMKAEIEPRKCGVFVYGYFFIYDIALFCSAGLRTLFLVLCSL